MRPKPNATIDATPLLFRHATPRISSPSSDLPGHYDHGAQLWMIETRNGLVPVVEAAALAQLETNTSTRVREEGDDEDFSNTVGLAAALSLKTTTAVQMEADDLDRSTDLRAVDVLLDTSTVTKTRQEGVDDDLTSDATLGTPRRLDTLAELATKTETQQESDDQISAGAMLELETRTLNNQEGVDQSFPRMLLELQTKTFADVEGDDDSSLIH